MLFLLDTNCWMQLLRNREHAREVEDLLHGVPAPLVLVTDYSLHSMLNIARKKGALQALSAFLGRSGFGVSVAVVDVPPARLSLVIETMHAHGLDVDDAYQYVAAELNGLRLVSFDADFDRTPNGRLSPAAALQLFKDEQAKPQQEA